jgi:hypothetical protein
MLDMNNSIQIAGGLFGSSRLESSIKDLNNALKLELEGIKIGAGHRFATRIRLEVDEKRVDIYEIINSDFEEKRKFYTILNQWAEKYGEKPIDKKHPFEVFIEDLQSIFGKNETSMRDKKEGERTIYDDLDFYNAMQSTLKKYVLGEMAKLEKSNANESQKIIIHIIEIITQNFTPLQKDPAIIRHLGLCTSILKILAITAQKTPMKFIETMASIYRSMPTFRYGCGEQKVIEMALMWLEKDNATGEVKDESLYSEEQFDLILKKLGTFDKLYIILPTLVNDRRMKNLLYGKDKKSKGKLINWMIYVRQFLQKRKWDENIPENKRQFWQKFVESYYNLVHFTFPQLFGTQAATVKEVKKSTGFFSGLVNTFGNNSSGKKDPDFQKIRNNLYTETINWLAILKPHEYLKLLRASLDTFPDMLTHRNFPRFTELDNKILNIFYLYIDRETGNPMKRGDNDFAHMKKTFDNFGYVLKHHRQNDNLIDKLYEDIPFNRKFYRNLKKVVKMYEKEAAKFKFKLEKGEADWEAINADFYDKLFYAVINIDGIVLEDGIFELEDYVTHRLEIESVQQFLPKKFSGKYPMDDKVLIKYIKEEEVGRNSIMRKESAKDPFQKVLLSLKKEFSDVNPKQYTNLLINGEVISPNESLKWYMDTEFYSKKFDNTSDPLKQIKDDIEPKGSDKEKASTLDKVDRIEVRDLSADTQESQISAIVDENLPEVSSLSGEITNLLKIIEEQGNHLNETDGLIDQLIKDETTLLDSVTDQIDDVNRMIEANDLDVYSKKKKAKTTVKVTTKRTETTESQEGGALNKYYVGKYTTGKNQNKMLYKLIGKPIYFYINDLNKKKRVDINSSRITM